MKVEPLASARETADVLGHAYSTYLALFHPFVPFVTERLWSELFSAGSDDEMLIHARWPAASDDHRYPEEAEGVAAVERLVQAVRGLRVEQNLDAGAKVELEVRPLAHDATLRSAEEIIGRLVRAESVTFVDSDPSERPGAAVAVDAAFQAAVRLGSADRDAERQRLEKQLADAEKRLVGLDKQLANENFVTKANPKAVESVRKNAEDCRATIESAKERLAVLGG